MILLASCLRFIFMMLKLLCECFLGIQFVDMQQNADDFYTVINICAKLLIGWMDRECWICWEERDLFLLVIPSIGTCGNHLFAFSETLWKTKLKFLKQMEKSILKEKPLIHSYSKLVLVFPFFFLIFHLHGLILIALFGSRITTSPSSFSYRPS